MNEMEEFLNLGAVVKVRRAYDDELYKFIELMKSVGFLNKYINYFEKGCCYDKRFNEFSDIVFWNLVEINGGNLNDTCIEFQWGKGFTFGDGKAYLDYDSDIKIITVDELIKACNKEELFKMNFRDINFKDEIEDKEVALELDNFVNFYDWSIVKFPDEKYNILDEELNKFDFDEDTSLSEIIERVYFRMLDYFMNEDCVLDQVEDGEFEYVKRKYENYIEIGKKLKLLDEEKIKECNNWFKEIEEESKDLEINKEI